MVSIVPQQFLKELGQICLQRRRRQKARRENRFELFHGDCFDYMETIEDKSIDVVFGDIPYQMLNAKWDKKGSFNVPKYMQEVFRIAKDDAPIILTCCSKFTMKLAILGRERYNHNMVWVKKNSSNPFIGNKRPAPRHEDILVFYKNQPQIYNKMKKWWHAVFENQNEPHTKLPKSMAELDKFLKENTQMIIGGRKKIHKHKEGQDYCMSVKKYANRGWKYWTALPTTIIEGIPTERSKFNPTHKPIPLMIRLLKYYVTKESVVFDATFGSGSTIEACKQLGCRFKGSEMDKRQYDHSYQKYILN